MWRVVRIVQLDAPSERIIGPFPPDPDGVFGNGGAAHRWIEENRTDKWIMVQDMPLEPPRPQPKSLGMGKGGPADLSEREGFGEG
jgi:hypothetical protein